jgi:hypothetical protein
MFRSARCAHWHAFIDGEDRQCPNRIGWFRRSLGHVLCRKHARTSA